ncbi:MAG TPA: helix-turn-helix transcriptional regulator [Bacteroidia bacterium]|jgi:transcriptional regulator with XRE-family HTH domain|nr:helix-turn-helix transcriptional regulator [Bacteroidia bacterium]
MNRIKEILKEQGRNQLWLAARLGEGYSRVTGYCNNKKALTPPMLDRIAAALEVDVTELYRHN